MEITIKKLKSFDPCSDGFEWFVEKKIDNLRDFISLCKKDAHLDWANWLIVRLMNKKQRVMYSVYSARSVLENFEKKYPDDDRPRKAIEAAEAYIKNPCADSAYSAASSAADSAANSAADSADSAARSAYSATYSATYSAYSARSAYSSTYSSTYRKAMTKLIDHGVGILKNTEK